MNWIQLLTGIGLGAIIVKALDIFWLHDMQQDSLRRAWLRERRLQAFTDVTKEFISFGMHEEGLHSVFQSYGVIAQALLLIDDAKLRKRIDHFIVQMNRMNDLMDSKDETKKAESGVIYESLVSESREIIDLLRNIVLGDK